MWPTFVTGEEPMSHGLYSKWSWRPETMSLSRYHGRHLTPFWKPLAQQGTSVGIFDVPFAPQVGVTRGFEVCEWWAHDTTGTGLRAAPDKILSIAKQSPAHPLSANRFFNASPDRTNHLKDLTSACIDGVKLRGTLTQRLIRETEPQLSLIVFPEIHHASHQLWHTVDPDHQIYDGRLNGRAPDPLLKDVYRAVNQQIAGLIEIVGSNATVMVFALHGMQPALGFPTFLGPLLTGHGFSRLANWSSQSWTERALSLFSAMKRHSPAALRRLYYALAPVAATHTLARPTMLPVYDFENTRAFSLPTDQYGWIRINLIGRELKGTVPLVEYNEICNQLEELLLTLTTEDGQLLVKDICRTAVNAEIASVNPLPDLVVHWHDAAFGSSLKIRDSKIQVAPFEEIDRSTCSGGVLHLSRQSRFTTKRRRSREAPGPIDYSKSVTARTKLRSEANSQDEQISFGGDCLLDRRRGRGKTWRS